MLGTFPELPEAPETGQRATRVAIVIADSAGDHATALSGTRIVVQLTDVVTTKSEGPSSATSDTHLHLIGTMLLPPVNGSSLVIDAPGGR